MIGNAKLCRCGGIIQDKKCDRCHKGEKQKPKTTVRGYGYDWQQFRLNYLKARIRKGTYYCDDCGKLFIKPWGTKPELHHTIKVSDNSRHRLDPSVILLLHSSCHALRTARGE